MPLPLSIIYQDDDLLVINKPSGIALFADRSGSDDLWSILRDQIPGTLYQVHRLDKGTSGVLLLARRPEVQARLNRAFNKRDVRKFYLARVLGTPDIRGSARIDLALRKGRKSRFRVAGPREQIRFQQSRWSLPSQHQDPEGLPSLTRVRVLQPGEHALLLLQPETGRSHQLRVHLSWIGHPILGDHLYGRPNDPAQQFTRLALHAHSLLIPGADGRLRRFIASAPADIVGND